MHDYFIEGRLIGTKGFQTITDGLLVIDGQRIVYAGEKGAIDSKKLYDEGAAQTLKACSIAPGFFDCHAHLNGEEDAGYFADGKLLGDRLLGAAYQAGLILDSGFTCVRDMSQAGLYLSRAQERGILRSPRIVPGGRLLGCTSGHIDNDPELSKEMYNRLSQDYRLCDGPDDCTQAVREQFRQGARFIKICATGGVSSASDDVDDLQFSPEELRAIVDEARRHHSYVCAHCTGSEGAYQALVAGVSCIEHGVMLTEREIDLMARNKATLVTTLAISLHVAQFPGLPDWMRSKAARCAESNIKTIQMARKAGIRIALGSDFSNSPNTRYSTLGREFVAMTAAGVSNIEAIAAGTINAAQLLSMENDAGTLEAGKLADFVLIDGDPLYDISVLADSKNVKSVFLGGKKVK